LAPALARRLPHAAFVAPNAPDPCDMAPFGHQWFSLRDRREAVLLIHGDAAEVVPVQALFAAIAGLQAAGIAVQWSIREGLPHAIDPESIEHGAEFIDAALRVPHGRPTYQLRDSR